MHIYWKLKNISVSLSGFVYLIKPFYVNLYCPNVLLVREFVTTTKGIEYDRVFH